MRQRKEEERREEEEQPDDRPGKEREEGLSAADWYDEYVSLFTTGHVLPVYHACYPPKDNCLSRVFNYCNEFFFFFFLVLSKAFFLFVFGFSLDN